MHVLSQESISMPNLIKICAVVWPRKRDRQTITFAFIILIWIIMRQHMLPIVGVYCLPHCWVKQLIIVLIKCYIICNIVLMSMVTISIKYMLLTARYVQKVNAGSSSICCLWFWQRPFRGVVAAHAAIHLNNFLEPDWTFTPSWAWWTNHPH